MCTLSSNAYRGAPTSRSFGTSLTSFNHLTDYEARSSTCSVWPAAAGPPDRPIVFASDPRRSPRPFGGSRLRGRFKPSTIALDSQVTLSATRNIVPDKGSTICADLRFPEGFADGVRAHACAPTATAAFSPMFDAVGWRFSTHAFSCVSEWTHPQGVYFHQLEAPARAFSNPRARALAKEACIAVKRCGAPYPYARRPHDSTIASRRGFPSAGRSSWPAISGSLCNNCILLEQAERA